MDDTGCEGLVELDVDLGKLAAVGAEHLRQRREHGRADEAYAEEADFATADAACVVEVFLDVMEGAAGAFEEDFFGAGEFDGSRGAGKGGEAEDGFELTNLLREGRLSKIETLGNAAEVELFRNGDEVAEFNVAIHI